MYAPGSSSPGRYRRGDGSRHAQGISNHRGAGVNVESARTRTSIDIQPDTRPYDLLEIALEIEIEIEDDAPSPSFPLVLAISMLCGALALGLGVAFLWL